MLLHAGTLKDKLKHTEGLLANTTRDYIIIRRQCQQNEQVKMEKTEALRITERENQGDRLELILRHDGEVKSLKVCIPIPVSFTAWQGCVTIENK
jgi:hypothetical protein